MNIFWGANTFFECTTVLTHLTRIYDTITPCHADQSHSSPFINIFSDAVTMRHYLTRHSHQGVQRHHSVQAHVLISQIYAFALQIFRFGIKSSVLLKISFPVKEEGARYRWSIFCSFTKVWCQLKIIFVIIFKMFFMKKKLQYFRLIKK